MVWLFPPQNQVSREIRYALTSLPVISLPTVALFFAEVRGYSKLYDSVDGCPLGRWARAAAVALILRVADGGLL